MAPIIADAAEEWRLIPSAPRYEVSSLGRCRRRVQSSGARAGRILGQHLSHNGYLRVAMMVNCKRENRGVHRMVCEAFHGPPPSADHVAAHSDGDKINNVPANLRWATQSENMQDRVRHGSPYTGMTAAHRKLDFGAVAEIRSDPGAYGSHLVLAARFGVSRSCIMAIRNRRRGMWPDVPFPGESA